MRKKPGLCAGVEVTLEQIKAAVAEVLAADKERLLVERYKANSERRWLRYLQNL